MLDWLRPLWLMFYSPTRAVSEARDNAPLVPAILLAFLAQTAFALYSQMPFLMTLFGRRATFIVPRVLIQSFSSIIITALIFVPMTILIAGWFERRGSFRLTLQQEYASAASAVFYGVAAANLAALLLAFLAMTSGWATAASEWYIARLIEAQQQQPEMARWISQDTLNPLLLQMALLQTLILPFLAVFTFVAVRVVFRLSRLRAIVVVLGSTAVTLIASFMLSNVFGALFASPFIVLLIFFLLRGYLSEATRGHRARLSFKQNLEAATLNPADASAHYNLGLIHQQRNELAQARQRFERAIEIDADEVDAHYQLGRIARAENRLADAIKHFEPVVERDEAHAQHEIWREIGATYFAAGQFEDARNALERFLAQRQSDPEGLYLMGRTHAALGHEREAAASMQACIEAVKTAPAYKYRTEKRWLNEAQEFLRQ